MELLSVVVVPARDEQDEIAGCLRALAAQTVAPWQVVVVADACADRTASIAAETGVALGLPLTVIEGPGAGAGAARRMGMDTACARLLEAGCPEGLIACTDADSRPAEDWLHRQLAHLAAGAPVVAGIIELDREQAAALPGSVRRRRSREALARLERVRRGDPGAGHHHFAGASIGVTAETYRSVGGIEPVTALEDAAFAERLAGHGIPVVRASDVIVRTSARATGRARRGLAVDLAVSAWADRRRYKAEQFSISTLRALKGSREVTVVVPTKECAATITGVLEITVRRLADAGLVDELVVVDAGSVDGTAAAAAPACDRVLQQDDLLPWLGPARGKGDAMWRALHCTTGEIVCFLDGDTTDPDPRHLLGLLGPLLTDESIQLVKGTFERPLRTPDGDIAHGGGRVTELMARPLLNLHVPLLAGFTQPLAGEFAGRRGLLEQLPFPVGYGVEIALLIDAVRTRGLDSLAECDLGTRHNRHQPLRELGEMAYAVLAAVERRLDGRTSPLGGHYLRPWNDMLVTEVPITERPPIAEFRSAGQPVPEELAREV